MKRATIVAFGKRIPGLETLLYWMQVSLQDDGISYKNQPKSPEMSENYHEAKAPERVFCRL